MKWYHSYETLELSTPSRLDGVDFENEARYRKEGARFIMEIGNKLGLYPFSKQNLQKKQCEGVYFCLYSTEF